MMTIQKNVIEQFTATINKIPFNRILGLTLGAIESDHVVMSFNMKEELIGNFMHGILHGGVISSVLDMAGGTMAMVAAMQKRVELDLAELAATLSKSSTVNLHIDYLKPGKGEQFTAKAWVLHSGKKITFTRMELRNHSDDLIAAGTGTYLIG